jgi:hypothetical protein
MLPATGPRTSGVKTRQFARLFGTAEEDTAKPEKSLSSGAKAHWFQGLYAGAQAPAS